MIEIENMRSARARETLDKSNILKMPEKIKTQTGQGKGIKERRAPKQPNQNPPPSSPPGSLETGLSPDLQVKKPKR